MLLLPVDRALTHPWSLSALLLLATNDHVLKGSGWVPGVLTGKLSDVAGLFLAPILLAVLVRARTRQARAFCYGAVAVVFASLELSPTLTEFVGRYTGAVMWPDPTDLIALVALFPSWALVASQSPVSRSNLQIEVPVVAALALFFCAASSSATPALYAPNAAKAGNFGASAVLHNGSDESINVEIRQYTDVSCDALASKTAPHLTEGSLSYWTLGPHQNMPLNWGPTPNPPPPCRAVAVDGDVFVYRNDQVLFRFHPNFGVPTSGAVILDPDRGTLAVSPLQKLSP